MYWSVGDSCSRLCQCAVTGKNCKTPLFPSLAFFTSCLIASTLPHTLTGEIHSSHLAQSNSVKDFISLVQIPVSPKLLFHSMLPITCILQSHIFVFHDLQTNDYWQNTKTFNNYYRVELGSRYLCIKSWWKTLKRSNRGFRASIGGKIVSLQNEQNKKHLNVYGKSASLSFDILLPKMTSSTILITTHRQRFSRVPSSELLA